MDLTYLMLTGSLSGLVSVLLHSILASALASLIERTHRVHVRAVRWPNNPEGALRVSPHIFTTHDDIEKLVQGLQFALR